MPPSTAPAADPATALTLRILGSLSEGHKEGFAARLWTGETAELGSGPAEFTLALKHPGALRAMFNLFDRVGLGESYVFDDFDVEGDVFAFTRWLRHVLLLADRTSLAGKLRLLWSLRRLPNRRNPRDLSKAGRPAGDRSPDQDRAAIEHSYDLPGEFYRLFLDRNMQYTCGYFATPDEDLDAAQLRKMDYVCRKLRLKPGERLLDVGCGWGGLVMHAARHYGVEAVGVTLSGAQAKWAEQAVQQAGLAGRVRIVRSDYRDFRDPGGFDKAVSVGMAEHVGVKNLPLFFRRVAENLRPGGAYLHHSITLRPFTPYPRWTAFARKYVFPNGELQTILRVQESAALAGLEVRDVENLREHYVLTLENWVRRLEANREAALRLVGEVSYRVYRLYMAGATMGFRHGTYGLYQCLVVKPTAEGRAELPLTRADWYADRESPPTAVGGLSNVTS